MGASGEQYLTIREAAERLNVNPRTINRWIHKGELDAVKLPGRAGGEFRVSTTELQRLLGEIPTNDVAALRSERNRMRALLTSIWEACDHAIYVSGRGYEVLLNPDLYNQVRDIIDRE